VQADPGIETLTSGLKLKHKHKNIKQKYRMCKWPLKTINRRQMYLIRRQSMSNFVKAKIHYTSFPVASR